jgi:hypothetical protein
MGLCDYRLSDEGRQAFLDADRTVSDEADRVGHRFERPDIEPMFVDREPPFGAGTDVTNVVDLGYPIGSIQMAGQPIILLSDAVTGGGYATIGTVISPDRSRLAQIPTYENVAFESVTIEEALDARAALDERFERDAGVERVDGVEHRVEVGLGVGERADDVAGRLGVADDDRREAGVVEPDGEGVIEVGDEGVEQPFQAPAVAGADPRTVVREAVGGAGVGVAGGRLGERLHGGDSAVESGDEAVGQPHGVGADEVERLHTRRSVRGPLTVTRPGESHADESRTTVA